MKIFNFECNGNGVLRSDGCTGMYALAKRPSCKDKHNQ